MADGRHLRLVADELLERAVATAEAQQEHPYRRPDRVRPVVWVAAIAFCLGVYGLIVLVAVKLAESL